MLEKFKEDFEYYEGYKRQANSTLRHLKGKVESVSKNIDILEENLVSMDASLKHQGSEIRKIDIKMKKHKHHSCECKDKQKSNTN